MSPGHHHPCRLSPLPRLPVLLLKSHSTDSSIHPSLLWVDFRYLCRLLDPFRLLLTVTLNIIVVVIASEKWCSHVLLFPCPYFLLPSCPFNDLFIFLQNWMCSMVPQAVYPFHQLSVKHLSPTCCQSVRREWLKCTSSPSSLWYVIWCSFIVTSPSCPSTPPHCSFMASTSPGKCCQCMCIHCIV